MTRLKWLLCAILLTGSLGREAKAQVKAASCNASDVQTAINAATESQTVNIPAGTCSWTAGVTISGKGIKVQGAGSGRIIAYDNGIEELTVGTGTLTMTIAGYSPGFSASSITTGETLRVYETNNRVNFMQGTVMSLTGSTLVMNVTSTGGSGTTHRWLISTLPSTVIINNATTATMFTVTEDTSVDTSISGIQFAAGTASCSSAACYNVEIYWASGGRPVLIHDVWMQVGESELIEFNSNRGVVWNSSFDASTGNYTPPIISAVRIKIDPPASGQQQSWTQPSFWGTLDTTGQNNVYIETDDFHALGAASDNDDNGRMVWRYSLMDNSAWSTHGADTSSYGGRTFEIYNNTAVFNGYSDGTTFNLGNGSFFVRGGSFVMHDNTLPALVSQDYGTKSDVKMTVMNLQRNGGPDPCWGQGTSGAADYHAPRQIGMGYVTGTGTATYPADGMNASTTDSVTYVGDSEPGYIWNNSRVPLSNISISDYGTGQSGSCTGTVDTSSNYIVLNRDFFNGSTAKPGYAPYTYPHPLTLGSTTSSDPAPPTSLTAAVD